MFGKTTIRHRKSTLRNSRVLQNTPGGGRFGSSRRPPVRRLAACLSVCLSICLAFTMMPAPSLAASPDQAAETGLCEHHPVHTAECGYQEARPGHPCGHRHTADCRADELVCGYIEDKTATGSDAAHVHTRDCYKLDCPHERGEHTVKDGEADKEGGLGQGGSCGYTEAVEGHPCGYVCTKCGQPDKDGGNGTPANGNHLPAPEETKPEADKPNGIEGIVITSFQELNEAVRYQTVKAGTPLEELILPDTLSAMARTAGENEEPVEVKIEGVAWEPDQLYDGSAGEFIFTALAAEYPPGVDWPVITITVAEQPAPEPTPYETALALFAALPGPATVAGMSDEEKDVLAAQIGGVLDALFAMTDEDYARFMAEHANDMAIVAALQDALTDGMETLEATAPVGPLLLGKCTTY